MSKFDALRKVAIPKTRNAENVSTQYAGRGRPRAKRSDPAYRQVTAYVQRDTYKAVQVRLLEQEREFSELVQELLAGWLKG